MNIREKYDYYKSLFRNIVSVNEFYSYGNDAFIIQNIFENKYILNLNNYKNTNSIEKFLILGLDFTVINSREHYKLIKFKKNINMNSLNNGICNVYLNLLKSKHTKHNALRNDNKFKSISAVPLLIIKTELKGGV